MLCGLDSNVDVLLTGSSKAPDGLSVDRIDEAMKTMSSTCRTEAKDESAAQLDSSAVDRINKFVVDK